MKKLLGILVLGLCLFIWDNAYTSSNSLDGNGVCNEIL